MECPYCHAEAPAEEEFCPSCGRSLELQEPAWTGADEAEDRTELWTPPPGEEATGTARDELTGTDGWSLPAPSETAAFGVAGALPSGSRLGRRYEILQLLGEGGMGSVYKARDLELDRLVALKIIRPDLAKDPEVLQRFKQEIILARQVSHRNVIRIYDLGQADGIKFISMEYVEGRDLHSVLKEKGSLPVEEAVEIMEQVCLALEEAHEEGVVHRDLKPHNIMLGPDGRVVVMDFGIARSVQITGMTQTGSLLGTPDYMSPEQVKGEHVDARSDLFALGVIFYQLLTGEVPYKADSPMASMYQRTTERAKPVREVNPRVPGFLGDVIARCLEISAQRRYQSARELLHDLEVFRGATPRTMAHTLRRLRPVRTARGRRLALIGAAVAAVLLATLATLMLRSRAVPLGDEPGAPGTVKTLSLAILPFRNASGNEELDWLSTGLAEMLRTDVAQSEHLRTVSPERLFQILKDLRISADTSLDPSTRKRVAEFSNADSVLWGQFLKFGNSIRIDATLEDVGREESIALKAEASSQDDLLQAVEQLAKSLRESLALSADGVEALQAKAFIPSSLSVKALRNYSEGAELMRLGYNLEAVRHFQSAIEADPEFALAYAKLALTHDLLGHDDEAREYSTQAMRLSEELPLQERYLVQATDARIRYDNQRAIEAYQRLLELRPGETDLHYELAGVYEDEARFELAEEHYQKVLAGDPQNVSALLATGRVRIKNGESQKSLDPLNRALSLAIQVENQEAKANVLQAIGIAYRFMGRYQDALRNFEESLEIKRTIQDDRGMAASLSEIGSVLEAFGRKQEAIEHLLQAIEIRREIGDEYGLALDLMSLSSIERSQGNFTGALGAAREALEIQTEIEDHWNQALSLTSIGNIYVLQGQYEDSMVYYQRALELAERSGTAADRAVALHNLAEGFVRLGRFDQALDHHLRSLEQWRLDGDELGVADESSAMGRLFLLQGRYGAGLSAIEEAVEVFRTRGESGFRYVEALANYGHALSQVGRGEEADSALEEALELAEQSDDQAMMAQILIYQGDRLLLRGDFSGARPPLERAAAIARERGDPLLLATAQLTRGRADALGDRPQRALATLQRVREDAGRLGLRFEAANASLYLGVARAASGDLEEAAGELQECLRASESLASSPLEMVVHHHLAETLRALGRADEADPHARRAAELLAALQQESKSPRLLERVDLEAIAAAGKA